MPLSENAVHRRFVGQERQEYCDKAKTAKGPSGDEQKSEDRRKEMRIECHYPIHGGERNGKREDDHRWTAKPGSPLKQSRRFFGGRRPILFVGPLVEQVH